MSAFGEKIQTDPGARQRVGDSAPTLNLPLSGEITTGVGGYPLFIAPWDGKVEGVYMAVGADGKDDSNALSLEGDVHIGSTSVLSTRPKIAHVSGEASAARSTFDSDSGVTAPVIDTDNNSFNAGDIIYGRMDLVRTASPTTEMSNGILSIIISRDPAYKD